MSEQAKDAPDHTMASADVQATGEGPKIYAVSNLRAYLKPDLAEELTTAEGVPATCGSEVVCSCVPVETCVCNTVTYHVGGSPGCPCQCQCTGTGGLYWYPY
jgi:hypothetical protein